MSNASVAQPTSDGGPKIRLGIMMFLQYAVWGIWLPVLAIYLMATPDDGGLGFTGADVGWILGVAAASGAITAPFIAGQIADRFLNAEIALGLLLLAGGVINVGLAYVTDFLPFMLLSVAYSICYMPTIALTNSICFANLSDPDTSFPRVRIWGTVGWIVSSTLFGLLYLNTNVTLTWMPWFFQGDPKPNANALIANALVFSGVISILYGFFAFVLLPRTRPSKSTSHPLAFLEAFGLLRYRGVLVLTIASLAISMIHNVYFVRTGPWLESIGFPKGDIGAVMSVGQIVEIFVLGVLGWFLKRLGFRLVITLGAIAYFLRFADFAWATDGDKNLAFIGIALHGFCSHSSSRPPSCSSYRAAPKGGSGTRPRPRSGSQILGIGPILSGFLNGWLDQSSACEPARPRRMPVGIDDDVVAGDFLTDRVGIACPRNAGPVPATRPSGGRSRSSAALAAVLVVVAFTDDSAKSAASADAVSE